MRELVLLRTHIFDEATRSFCDYLRETSGRDVALICEEGGGPVDVGKGRAKIGLDRAHVEAMGLHTPKNFGWLCGDYFLYVGMQALPHYDRYWLVEYDVRLSFAEGREFFDLFADPGVDFLAFMMHEAGPNWNWHAVMLPFSPRVHACNFSIVAASRKALDHALAARRRMSQGFAETQAQDPARRWPNDESFMATLLNEGGFRCRGLNGMGRRLSTPETYREGAPMSHRRIAGMTPNGMVYHPVHVGERFLRKADSFVQMQEGRGISLARAEALFTQELRDDILLEGGPEALARHDRRIAALKQRLTA